MEITSQQLNQVTPGGGVLKLTLSRKKPLKITTRAPSGEPDPSQTTVKTVYDPKKEKGDQTERGTINITQTGLGQSRREEAPPIGGREPLQEGENSRLNRTPGEQESPHDKGSKKMKMIMENPMGMVAQLVMVVQMGVEVQMKMESHPEEEGENILEEMENLEEVMGDQAPVMMMGVGMDLPLPHQILHHLEEGDIGGPDLFM